MLLLTRISKIYFFIPLSLRYNLKIHQSVYPCYIISIVKNFQLYAQKKYYNSNKMTENYKRITVLLSAIIIVLLFGLIHKINNAGEINISEKKLVDIYNPFEGSRDNAGEVNSSPKSLVDIYNQYEGSRQFDHWLEYATHYDVHLQQILKNIPKSNTFRMLEIGVQSGGSVEVWRSYFSSQLLYYVGMDIQPNCKRSEDINQNIFIEIASQSSPQELIQICKKHGPFDFIVDDGGHEYNQMETSLNTLFVNDMCMTRNSLYVIEDMHTMASKDISHEKVPNIPSEIFRKMHYYWFAGKYFKFSKAYNMTELDFNKDWADSVDSITLYDSIMFVHRGYGTRNMHRIKKGKDRIPYR